MDLYLNATTARQEFSQMLDRAVFDRPQFIEHAKDHIMVLGTDMLGLALASNVVHAHVQEEDDSSFVASAQEIEGLIATGESEEAAMTNLAQELSEYANEYYAEFGLYSRSPNRKAHLPYVLRALSLGTPSKVREMVVCQAGKN